jgi:Fe2+ transport system protein FeoA
MNKKVSEVTNVVLAELKKNDVFKIVGFDKSCGNFKHRLSDLGISKGQIGQIINKSIFGPIEVDIEGRKLALGRGMTKKIFVKKFECPVL